MVDTCAAEFAAETPYFYATYAAAGSAPEAPPVPRPAALVIGSGPVRIGQGIEFDYCAVKAADTLRRTAGSAVMVNSNPETVSTDFDASTRLYFEPLDAESVRSVIERRVDGAGGRRPLPAIVAFGGQTPLNLAAPLAAGGVPLLGSDLEAIDQAEERTRFAALLDRLGIPQPEGGMAHSVEEALTPRGADRLPGHRPPGVRHRRPGDRLLLLARGPRPPARRRHRRRSRPARPHRPLPRGHRGRRRRRLRRRARAHPGAARARRASRRPLRRLGRDVPAAAVSEGDQGLIVATMERVVLALGARGLVNAQFIVRDDGVYLIEVNPRASRTVPFLSKVTGVPMVELAVRIALGATLAELGWGGGLLPPRRSSRSRHRRSRPPSCAGVDPSVGPYMQSTGEVIGIHEDRRVALAKALPAPRSSPPRAGRRRRALALLSIADRDKARPARGSPPRSSRGLPAGGDRRDARRARGGRVRARARGQARRGARHGRRRDGHPRPHRPRPTCGSS